VLVVEPDAAISRAIQRSCADIAQVTACPHFEGARSRILEAPPDVLVTNLRLEEYNGLHLVLLLVNADAPTRCLVHTDRPDLYLAREIQSLGGFFEHTDRLQHSLPSYLRATLPSNDRRNPERGDRRILSRGGRRSSDVHTAA
jgi:two-component system nitrogen regulation response regulator GlnG